MPLLRLDLPQNSFGNSFYFTDFTGLSEDVHRTSSRAVFRRFLPRGVSDLLSDVIHRTDQSGDTSGGGNRDVTAAAAGV